MTRNWLKSKLKDLENTGLVDVKFDIDLSRGKASEEAVLQEVKALYTAVDNGNSFPLNFNDSMVTR